MCDEQWCVKSLFKCENWLDKLIFLGYIVFKEGIFMDLKTLRLMLHGKRPTNVMEIKNLSVLLGYKWWIVEGLSMVVNIIYMSKLLSMNELSKSLRVE